ncbi:4-hydroxy-tetrahydrodipicolinate synthase [Vreelandella populi]|uniref:4-hydroxy-tetrahydrodipicolinate synthase n=1 Tax=Vreelandella populi TaxID=2498858 RepID=A0A3S0WIZ2_9GAMM|nr:4-hydroxy-tetrahydrodipicolinate synthase [Halomonas populi]RUR42494.1 4-hydroxy-tetrahydrodipicolinate synthase [Halomonas populi]RUR45900.1 4-hydroxy-tetrahydrodipicolinate synthase [Halomonas populi]RUR57204.1 4-hydroxy-tetrahydrodipicolinate synthase [Halomonas populi]
MTLFKGIIPALITPMNDRQAVDEAALRTLVDTLIEKGVHGLFALGTNGEFFALNEDEKLKVAHIVVDQARGRVPVIVGTGAFTTQGVIDMNARMEQVGVDACSIITPYFNAVSQHELVVHYSAIAEQTKLPFMLYNIPAKTGGTISVDTVETLSHLPMVQGIKDSGGDFDRLTQLIGLKRDDFAVFTGTDSLILWGLLAGADGAVAATTNAVPDVVMTIYNAFQAGDMETAREAQEKLRVLRTAFGMATMPVVLKAAAELMGMPAGPTRAPALPLSEQQRQQLDELMQVYR